MRIPLCLLLPLVSCTWGLASAQALPPEVVQALARAKVPLEALSVLVVDAEGKAPPRLSHRATVPVNPASVMKLVTTYAALDLLGPGHTWRTPVFVEGAVREGTLYGNLYIKGSGDPKLVAERLWLLLRRVQGLGIKNIAGDIVLDRSAFEVAPVDAASFDGEPLRPYNATPEALLVNYKSVAMTFVPDRTANIATVQFEPPLAGVEFQKSLPLSPEKRNGNGNGNGGADCGDYRAKLLADFSSPQRISFAGSYPASCGEKVWSVAYMEPQSYSARVLQGLWREMGGQLSGTVREGRVPELSSAGGKVRLPVAFESVSPALAEVVRDINKHSNNVMAQQLFLTLSLNGAAHNGEAATLAKSQEVVRQWWTERISRDDVPSVGNGSGLSREDRISAQALASLLQNAYRSPLMPELMASLPITGVDGTLKNRRSVAQSSAHLKTGSLRDVTAVAGYVHGASGKRYALVAIVNHPNANAARAAFDALVTWTVSDPEAVRPTTAQ